MKKTLKKNWKYILFFILFILGIIIVIYINQSKKINFHKRKCFTNKITEEEKTLYKELIKITADILNNNNIDWIPIGGNLIAIYRENKLFLKWDDDFDMVINKNQVDDALNILQDELPKHNIDIINNRKWGENEGILYKIFFSKNSNKYVNDFDTYTWPFIDLFININKQDIDDDTYSLDYDEYPLIKKTIDGVNINIPSKGPRSYDAFKKDSIIDNCTEQDWVHSLEKNIPCIGDKQVLCKSI